MTYQTNKYYSPQRNSQLNRPDPHHPSPRFKRGLIKCIVIIGSILIAVAGVTFLLSSAQSYIKQQEQKQVTTSLNKNIDPLVAAHSNIKMSIAIYDPKNDLLRTYGQTSPFPAASTAKIMTALAYYHLVEQGKFDIDHPLGSFTAGFQIQQMINQSNNDSWELLVSEMGRPFLQKYAASIGSDYKVADNTLSASSLAKVLAQLQSGKLLNPAHTATLLSYMQNTNEEDLIPAGLPNDITVYHKFGLLNGTLHDASILQKDNKTYTFVVYTQNDTDSDDEERTQLIQQIAAATSSVLFK